MISDDTSQTLDIPVQLGDIDPREALPATAHIYLLLDTKRLEDWAYRPSPPDARVAAAIAPSVVELVQAVASFAPRRWLWAKGPMDYMEERGPLLVDASENPALLEQAITQWSAADGAIIIGSDADLDTLARHLSGLSLVTLPDQGQAIFNFRPLLLEPWLSALTPDNRAAWLGPMQRLLWRSHWHYQVSWYRLDHPASESVSAVPGWLHLHPAELTAFNANTRDHFARSLSEELLSISRYATLSPAQARLWVSRMLDETVQFRISDDTDVRRYFFLRSRYPGLIEDPKAQALLNDPVESPAGRLRNLSALAEKEFPDD